MKIGIVGFPRSGKTTVFNALTGLDASVGFGGDASRPNLGTIKVPDERIDRLSEIFSPKKTTYGEVVFVDYPGRPDASNAIDRSTIAQMRDADALVQVVRAFEDTAADRAANPQGDIDGFATELILADLEIVEKRLDRLRKEKGREKERALLERCREALESEQPLRRIEFSELEERELAGFGFLSRLPLLVLVNVDEADAGAALAPQIGALLERNGTIGLALSAKVEMEIAGLDEMDRGAFLADLGLQAPARDRFVRAAYGLLDLISFLTSGEDEVRAWPIRKGTAAVRAAGKIHSDIERGFIRAEVVAYDDFIELGSDAKCRDAGKLRLEGKDYQVRDGDIIHFRFNV